MTYPAADALAVKQLENRLASSLSRVRSDLEDLARDVEELQSKVDDTEDLDHTLRSLTERIEGLEYTTERLEGELGDHISDTDHALKQLTARVRLLENLVRPADDAPVADLDTIEPAWKELAATAQHGTEAAAGLLTEAARLTYQHAINSHDQAVLRRGDAQKRVIAAARTLASTAHWEPEHTSAARAFTTALTSEDNARANLGSLATKMNTARVALQADDRHRKEAAPAITEGEKATRKLAMTLRTRLARALADRAVLPTWFVTVLGPAPPATKTQEWIDLAVAVLVYRITHHITDPVVALGRPPENGSVSAIRHRDLTEALMGWNN